MRIDEQGFCSMLADNDFIMMLCRSKPMDEGKLIGLANLINNDWRFIKKLSATRIRKGLYVSNGTSIFTGNAVFSVIRLKDYSIAEMVERQSMCENVHRYYFVKGKKALL